MRRVWRSIGWAPQRSPSAAARTARHGARQTPPRGEGSKRHVLVLVLLPTFAYVTHGALLHLDVAKCVSSLVAARLVSSGTRGQVENNFHRLEASGVA